MESDRRAARTSRGRAAAARLLLTGALVMVLGAGCGSDDDTTETGASTTVGETTTSTGTATDTRTALDRLDAAMQEVESARMEISLDASGPNGSFTMTAEGVVKNADSVEEAQLTYQLPAQIAGAGEPGGGGEQELELRSLGDTAYVRSATLATLLGVDTPWVSMPLQDVSKLPVPVLGVASNSPSSSASLLDGATQVDEVGTEEVAGVETTQFAVTVDPAELPPEQAASFEGLFQDSFDMNVWIDGDNRLRQLTFTFSANLPTTQEPLDMSLTMTVLEYDLAPTIEAPPPDQTTNIADRLASPSSTTTIA